MSKAVYKLLGQAIVRHMSGNKEKAVELSLKAQKLYENEHRLNASVKEKVRQNSAM